MAVNLKSLIGRLDDTCRGALEGAAGLCLSRTNYDVEPEHFLLKLIEAPDADVSRILRHYEVSQSHLTKDLTQALEKLKTGNARTPALSPRVPQWVEEAWLLASIEYGAAKVRSGHLLLAFLMSDNLARLGREISKEFKNISVESLQKNLLDITSGSGEDREVGAIGEQTTAGDDGQPASAGKTKALDQFTVDLTAKARAGQIDPVLGRDFEIRQIVDILTRRRQNNPILTGEAGVGKTAVVEGFALRVAEGDVPPSLKGVAIRTLDLGLLQAGAGMKGEFENRLKGLIEEVKNSPTPIILFIDEAHTMIGAGGQAGQNDAANLLKPALARGELRTIAATTWSEYKKYFEKDPALTRRFQLVKVEEPSEQGCMVMMRGVVPALEKHHSVRILDDGAEAAVRLSHRYLPDRQLPDKAVSVLDTACARLSLGQNAMPAALEDATRQLDDIAVQTRVLEREKATGADHAERLEELKNWKTAEEARLANLRAQWNKEREIIEQIRDIRTQLEDHAKAKSSPANGDGTVGTGSQSTAPSAATAGAAQAAKVQGAGASPGSAAAGAQAQTQNGVAAAPPATVDVEGLRVKLAQLNDELEKVQGENPLMQACVDSQTIADVISGWTGIPVGKMMTDEINTVLALKDRLEQRVIGQSHGLEAIAQRIRTARAGLTDPRRPVGVFLLVGPSGVGKTETALTLADTLYGGEKNLVTINMSEYQEAHTVSSMKGSPPGYVGYGEGGVLTEAVRRKPYSVVLLDEVEKAHPDVMELFYQVFDKGMLEDGEGREIDFKNTIIILTSNVGTDLVMKLTADPETTPSPEGLAKAMKPELNKIFKPAFMGRLVTVPYFPLRDEAMKTIVTLKLRKIQRRIRENHKIELNYDPAVVAEVAKRCTEVESGARNVDNILTNTMLPDISRYLLSRMADRQKPSSIRVSVADNGAFAYA